MPRIALSGARLVIVSPDHPSIDPGAVVDFVARLRAESGCSRRVASTAARRDTAIGTLVHRLVAPGPGVRLAALGDGRVVGYARTGSGAVHEPGLLVAVVDAWRSRGVGDLLTQAILHRAAGQGASCRDRLGEPLT